MVQLASDRPQTIEVWPASLLNTPERQKTPYKFLVKSNWACRLAWRFLGWMKALEPYYATVDRWTYVPHEQKALHDAMMEAAQGDLRYIWEGKAVFIVGGKTFSELTQSPVFTQQMMFKTGPFGISDPYRGRHIFDIPIHVVPSMTGMALVPKVFIEEVKQ